MEPSQDEKPAVLATEAVSKVEEQEEIGRFSAFLSFIGIEGGKSKILLLLILLVVLSSAWVSFMLMAPFGFPKNKMITVKPGDSLTTVSDLLYKENIIRSQGFFEFCVKVIGGTKPVAAGQYLFKEPISSCISSKDPSVAYRIVHGISGIPAITVTIPEGMSNREISVVLAKNIPKFDTAFFLEHARAREGFLFPDTYFFPENVTAQAAQTIMEDNFNKKMEPWAGPVEASGHTLREIVIMASILEKEATTEEDKAMVSGILWKRISIGMPLQVDASFMYLLNKKSSDVTVADKQVRSMYNTYLNKGLPGGPIGNPGLVAIRTAIRPTASAYLYYLSDSKGVMHYAKTFEEHVANKIKYLK